MKKVSLQWSGLAALAFVAGWFSFILGTVGISDSALVNSILLMVARVLP